MSQSNSHLSTTTTTSPSGVRDSLTGGLMLGVLPRKFTCLQLLTVPDSDNSGEEVSITVPFLRGAEFSSGKVAIEWVKRPGVITCCDDIKKVIKEIDNSSVKGYHISFGSFLSEEELGSMKLFTIFRTPENAMAAKFGSGTLLEGVEFVGSGKVVLNWLKKEGKSSSMNVHDSLDLAKATHCYDETTTVIYIPNA